MGIEDFIKTATIKELESLMAIMPDIPEFNKVRLLIKEIIIL
ncbi:hypothetical protein [Paenibacillus sp. BIHB 4019]|nr:hypothetical protein [Paenibacillus sp. BIHB 4019]